MKRKIAATGAFLTAIAVGIVSGSLFNPTQTQAATTVPTSAQTRQQQTQPQNAQMDPSKGGHVGQNGKKEVVLSGDAATKVTAAAQAAVSGGTVERVETDTEGATYEAHMTKTDGSRVTVKLDGSYKVTSVDEGMK